MAYNPYMDGNSSKSAQELAKKNNTGATNIRDYAKNLKSSIVAKVPVNTKSTTVSKVSSSSSKDLLPGITSYVPSSSPNYSADKNLVPNYVTSNVPNKVEQYNFNAGGTQPIQPLPLVQEQPKFNYDELKSILDKYYSEKTTPKYVSPYDDRINSALSKIENQKPFEFNTNNPALLQAQNQAMQMARRESASRGRLFDTYAQTKEQEKAQELLPAYYNIANSNYRDDQTNNYNLLNALRNADQTAYSRFNDMSNQDRANELEALNNSLKLFEAGATMQDRAKLESQQALEKTKQDEIKKYGIDLSPQARASEQTYLNMSANDRNRLSVYSNDIQARINELTRINPSSPDIPLLEAMRTNKLLNDRQLLSKYGADIGMKSPLIDEMASAEKQAQIKAIEAKEIATYGVPLSNTMRTYVSVANNIPYQDRQRLIKYSSNYAGIINQLAEVDPNNPDILKFVALRAEKILRDPRLLAQYGSEYGMQGQQIRNNAREEIKADLEILSKQMEAEKIKVQTAKEYREIDKLSASIRDIYANIAYMDKKTATQELERLAKAIEVSALPAIKRAEYNEILAGIAQKNASSEASRANAYQSYTSAEIDKRLADDKEILLQTQAEKERFEVEKVKEVARKELNSDAEAERVAKAYGEYIEHTSKNANNNYSTFMREALQLYGPSFLSPKQQESLQKIIYNAKEINKTDLTESLD